MSIIAKLKEKLEEERRTMRCCGNCRRAEQTARGIFCTVSSERRLTCINNDFSLWEKGMPLHTVNPKPDGEVM